jgi:uncharacterized protein (TIGR02246 family)
MRVAAALLLATCAVAASAAEVTVIRPRGFVADEWTYYVVVAGKPVTDLVAGERASFQVPADTHSLAIHCPKMGGGYDESRIDFNAAAAAFFVLHTTRDCVRIEPVQASAAASLMRQSVARANRRMEYDAGKVGAAEVAAAQASVPDAARDQVAAATAAWVEAFNNRDASRLAGLYDADAVLSDTREAKPRMGAGAIGDYYKSTAATRRVALGERTIRVFGDTAIDSGMLTFFEMRDGQATTTPGRYSLTYRNRGGKWLIVDHQSSPAAR